MNHTTPEAFMRDVVERAKVPQAELARLAGISYPTLHAWLNGRRNPSPDSMVKIAAALEQHSAELSGLADEVREWVKRHG